MGRVGGGWRATDRPQDSLSGREGARQGKGTRNPTESPVCVTRSLQGVTLPSAGRRYSGTVPEIPGSERDSFLFPVSASRGDSGWSVTSLPFDVGVGTMFPDRTSKTTLSGFPVSPLFVLSQGLALHSGSAPHSDTPVSNLRSRG